MEKVITVQMTVPSTRTWVLEEVGGAASGAGGGSVTQQAQGQVVTEMITVTVPGRSRYTSTVVF